jgi:hypothetical protein
MNGKPLGSRRSAAHRFSAVPKGMRAPAIAANFRCGTSEQAPRPFGIMHVSSNQHRLTNVFANIFPVPATDPVVLVKRVSRRKFP